MAQIKTKTEIAKIKRACTITDQIFAKLIKQDLKSFTEVEFRNLILSEIRKRQLKPSFSPIVTSGPRAGNEIHPKSTNAKLKGFVIIDFGVIYKKYMSDMTRTVFVGRPKKTDKLKYKKVFEAQRLGIKKVKTDAKCALADRAVRNYFGSLSKYFIHTLGHGIGTRIHEAPRIYTKRTRSYFRVNMVVTIEPGIYIKDKLGIRIEDTCLVTPGKAIVLTKSPKRLITFRTR